MTIQSSLGQTDESFREATLRNVISSDLDDVKYNYQLQFQMHANRVNMAVRAIVSSWKKSRPKLTMCKGKSRRRKGNSSN